MRPFWTVRIREGAPAGASLGLALARIRLCGEARAAAMAEAIWQDTLHRQDARPALQAGLARIAQGPDPRAAMIARTALGSGQSETATLGVGVTKYPSGANSTPSTAR